MIDVSKKKEEIIEYLSKNGPSLPLKIAKAVDMTNIFTTAILSELTNEKRVKTSNLKIGSSPLYLIPGQEDKLEKYENELKGPKKEAYLKSKMKNNPHY